MIDPRLLDIGSKVEVKFKGVMGILNAVVVGHDSKGFPILSNFDGSSVEDPLIINVTTQNYIIRGVWEYVERPEADRGKSTEVKFVPAFMAYETFKKQPAGKVVETALPSELAEKLPEEKDSDRAVTKKKGKKDGH